MLVSVQGLRALAAWLVVFHHFMQVFFDFKASTLMGHLLSTRGQVGVDLFFIISGFVIYVSTAGKQMPTTTFLIHRIARIAPAYWLFTLITAAIIAFAGDVMPVYGVSLKELVYSLLFLPSQNPGGFGLYPILPVGWSLNFEMLFYTIFALSFAVNERYRLWLVLALVTLICPILARQPFVSSFYTDPMVYEFVFGLGLGMLYRKNRLPEGLWVPLATIAISTAFLLNFDDQTPYRLFTWGIPSVLIVSSVIAMEPWFRRHRWLKHMGDWSYSVYLVHIIVLWSSDYLLRQRLDLSPYLTFALCIPAIMVLSWLSFELIEKRVSGWIKRRLT
ncbi:acyltransferase family protein [Larsenimonas salina]|uniref:acyltransferase family protein n=1 Tax=Larsenimonas salina TaxID=1295565 RepID=UPI00207365B1|nr:acyltransferase [Larsenimonas salina]MCM5705032.1 acyltransferase [Larsenimonas salina]